MKLGFTAILLLISASAYARPFAWVYGGPGVCPGCPESLMQSLKRVGFQVKRVGPGDFSRAKLKHVDLIAVPGGDEELDVKNALLKGESEAIHQWIEDGGHYLGVCLGGYLAVPVLIDSKDPIAGLNLFDGEVSNHSPTKKARMENILWKGKHRWMYFQDGPEFTLTHPDQADIWAYYEDGSIAAFQSTLGKGRIGLIGPHPEANQDWWDDDHLVDQDGADEDLLSDFTHSLIQK